MRINLRGNAFAAAMEQVVVGLSFVIFYGILVRQAGADLVGVMSLVLVLGSISMVANLGFAGAVGRFVPLFEGRGDRAATVRCIDTTLISTVGLYAAVLALAYLPFRSLITQQAGPEHGRLVAELMVPATAYVFLTGATSVTTLALTALHRSDLRLWANLAGSAVGLGIVIWGASEHGVVAGLWALAAQSGVVLVVTWLQLRGLIRELGLLPWRFGISMARELFQFGANLQAQSLLVAAVEPIARLLIGHFGTLADVTFFSMAARFVLQMRALIFAGAQPLLSAFSYLGETDATAASALYGRANAVILFLALLVFSATVGAAPFVGEIWVGAREKSFTLAVVLLSGGWLVNTMVLASYFMANALGRLRHNLAGHVVLLAAHLVLGPVLGFLFGPAGVAAAMGVSLAVSGLVMGIGNARLTPQLDRSGVGGQILFVALTGLAAVFAILAYGWLRERFPPIVSAVGSGAAWLLAAGPAILLHPERRILFSSSK